MSRQGTMISLAVGLIFAADAKADRIVLRGGGEIKGVVVPDASKPLRVVVQTESSAKPLEFDKKQIVQVVRDPGPLDEYLANRDHIDATAQAQYDFGVWCEDNKIVGPAEVHFAKAAELDPQFAPAQKKLGRVQHGGQWISYDKQREVQGLIKHKGKWISRVEKDRVNARASQESQENSWTSRIKMMRAKLLSDDPRQKAEAESQLAEIRDPAAIAGLIRVFANDGDAMRVRLAEILGAIDGSEATQALVRMIVAELNLNVRQAIVQEIIRRNDPDASTALIATLRSKDPDVVGRAAWALAASKSVVAVPKLVDALTQSEKRMVMAPVTGGASGGNMSGSYGFVQNVSPGVGGGIVGGGAVGGGSVVSTPSPNAAPGFSEVRSYGVITGVAMAEGAVAFGAGSVPFAYGASPGTSFGGGPAPSQSIPRQITIVKQNGEVLLALQSLTGVNFGFDRAAWRTWITRSFRPEPAPPRRVPQP